MTGQLGNLILSEFWIHFSNSSIIFNNWFIKPEWIVHFIQSCSFRICFDWAKSLVKIIWLSRARFRHWNDWMLFDTGPLSTWSTSTTKLLHGRRILIRFWFGPALSLLRKILLGYRIHHQIEMPLALSELLHINLLIETNLRR